MSRRHHPLAWYRERHLRWVAEYQRGDQVLDIARRDAVSTHTAYSAFWHLLGPAPRRTKREAA